MAWTPLWSRPHCGLDPPWPGPHCGLDPTVAWTHRGLNTQGPGPEGWSRWCGVGTTVWAALACPVSRARSQGLRQLALSCYLSFAPFDQCTGLLPSPFQSDICIQFPVPSLPCPHVGLLTLYCARVFICLHSRNIYGATAVCPTLCETLGIQRWRCNPNI